MELTAQVNDARQTISAEFPDTHIHLGMESLLGFRSSFQLFINVGLFGRCGHLTLPPL